MTTKETMTDTAFHVMTKRKKEIEFAKLWQEVAKTMDIPADRLARKKAQFYSGLMLDGRFASLKGNKWDLRSRRKFDEFHKDTDIDDLDDDEEIIEEAEEDDDAALPKTEEEY